MNTSFLSQKSFWTPAILSAILLGGFFAWELGFIESIPGPARPTPTTRDLWYTAIILALLSLNAGLLMWRSKNGTCPLGAKRVTGICGALGAVTLLCPMCLLLPLSLFGLSISLAFLAPFLPLLQIITLILLVVSTKILWPRS
ncbi:MAG: hypothetical protein O2904_01650 [bacterium]|nr:hypothetical protein [bacterium]